eukprot:8169312-Ditylum_brightwellii.AAC.1
MHQLEQIEEYHPIMGLWGSAIQYQFSSRSGLFALMCKENNMLDNCSFEAWTTGTLDAIQLHKDNNDDIKFFKGIKYCLEMVKNTNIQSWLNNNPIWKALQDKLQA